MNSTTPKTTQQNTKFSYPSTEAALYFIEDVMERAMIPFVLLGDVARSVVDNLDQEVNQPIEIGIQKRHLTEYALSTLPMFLPPDTEYGKKQITFTWDNTPVIVKVIHRDFAVLENPDQVFYRITHFSIPNPFDRYWKQRNFIQ